MNILIDYDNVHAKYRARGLQPVLQAVLDAVGCGPLGPYKRVSVRLYGGWFGVGSPTRNAQSLSAECRAGPYVLTVNDAVGSWTGIVAVELALGPISEPKLYFSETFRTNRSANGVLPRKTDAPGCVAPGGCAARTVLVGLAKGCTHQTCPVVFADLVEKSEQKMVDTMLVTDILELARQSVGEVVVVTTDDDIWPGIRQGLLWGLKVYHVHPVAGRKTPTHLIVNLPSGYRQSTVS